MTQESHYNHLKFGTVQEIENWEIWLVEAVENREGWHIVLVQCSRVHSENCCIFLRAQHLRRCLFLSTAWPTFSVGRRSCAAGVPATVPALQLPTWDTRAASLGIQWLGIRSSHDRLCLVKWIPEQLGHDVRTSGSSQSRACAHCWHDGSVILGPRTLCGRKCGIFGPSYC